MPKSSIPHKLLDLVELYRDRAVAHLNEEDPDAGLFWATGILALGDLAQAMSADDQIHPDAFAEISKHVVWAKKVARRVRGGSSENPSFSPAVARAYNTFLEEWESGL